MTLTLEQWKEILDSVNLNEGDILEAIKEKLKKQDQDTYQRWEETNFNLNHLFNASSTLLCIATFSGHLEIVKYLVKNKADVHIIDKYGNTPLHEAVRKRRLDIVECLVKNGADVDSQDRHGMSPLHYASGHMDIVNTLISNGADINLASLNIWYTLLLALEYNYPNAVKALVCKVPDVDRTVPDYRKKNGDSWTLLLWAAENGHKDVVDALIEKGADVNKVSGLAEWAPLHLAAENGYKDVVDALIEAGADVNKINTGRYTPISLAACYGHVDVVRILIKNGANFNGEYSTHRPIGWAISRGCKEVVELLLKKGVDVNTTTHEEGSTLLLDAVYAGYKEVVELLLKKGADVNKVDKYGRTPLTLAVRKYKIDMCELIVNHITKLEADGLYVSPENLQRKAEIMPKIEEKIFMYNHRPLIKIFQQKGFYFWYTLDKIKVFLEENREKLKVKLGVHEKSLIDFVDFEDVTVRHTPRLKLCAAVSVAIRNNAPSENLCNPSNSSSKHQTIDQACFSSVDEQVSHLAIETTGTVEHISTNVSEHSKISSEFESNGNQQSTQPELLTTNGNFSNITSDQISNIQNNNVQQNNSNNDAPRSGKKSKLPIVAALTLATAGIALGVAIAVYLEMLAVGIAVGACCLVAAAIIYYCNKPSKSLENSNAEMVTSEEIKTSCCT